MTGKLQRAARDFAPIAWPLVAAILSMVIGLGFVFAVIIMLGGLV